MEATKCLNPSDSGSRIGDRASGQGAKRVNAEQASKRSLMKSVARRVVERSASKIGTRTRRCRRHADPIPHARDAQRPEFAVGLRYKHSSDWLWPVSLLPERKRQFSQPPLDPVCLDVRKVLAIDAGRALIGAALGVGMRQNVVAADL